MDPQREKRHLKRQKNGIYSACIVQGQPNETNTKCTLKKIKNSSQLVNCIIQHSTSCNRTIQEQYFCSKVIRYLSQEKDIQFQRLKHRFIILIMFYGLFLHSESSFVSHFIPMCIVARAEYQQHNHCVWERYLLLFRQMLQCYTT